jgi:hypothetical protein
MERAFSVMFRRLFAVVLFLCAPGTCLPMTYISPLQTRPDAEEVVAFANWAWRPWSTLPLPKGAVWNSQPIKRIQISQNDLLKFLRAGRFETNSGSIAKLSESSKTEFYYCRGIFFTAKQQEYYWHLENEKTLFVWDHHSHRAAFTLEDGCQPIFSYTTNRFLIAPRKTDILSLVPSNNILRNRSAFSAKTNRTDKTMQREDNQNSKPIIFWAEYIHDPVQISEEFILKFINAGRPITSSLRQQPLFHGQLTENSGAIVLKSGKICFFDIWGPKDLYLETEDGASCVLELLD